MVVIDENILLMNAKAIEKWNGVANWLGELRVGCLNSSTFLW